MSDIGNHLLGRKPSPPDLRDYRLANFAGIGEGEAIYDPVTEINLAVKELQQTTITYKRWAATHYADVTKTHWWQAFNHLANAAGNTPPFPTADQTWEADFTLDQGNTGHCVGFGWAGWGNALPVDDQWVDADGHNIYYECKVIEGDPGGEDGAYTRDGAKAMLNRHRLSVYAFADTMDDILNHLRTKGPVVVGTDWTCVVPGTKVLTTDLDWLPVEKIEPGMKIVGFDENPRRDSRYREATVLANPCLPQTTYEVETDQGAVHVSENHRFVSSRAKEARKWRTPSELQPEDRLSYMGKPWERDETWEAGWLAGFYDGEGHLSGYEEGRRNANALVCAQKPGPTADTAMAILKNKGFDYTVRTDPATGVLKWHLKGPNAKLRFLGSVRPSRLLNVAHRAWQGHCTFNNAVSPAVVTRVRKIGQELVYAVGTSTRTLVTDGFLSHNSDMFDPDSGGYVHPTGSVAGGHCYLLYGVEGNSLIFKNSWGAGWGDYGSFRMRLPDFQTLLDAYGEAVAAVELPL